jgi:hypothetical protein
MRIRQLAVPAIAGLLIAFGAGPAFAQELDRAVVGDIPTGTFHYAAATFSNSPLWDVTGTYHLSGSSNGVTDSSTFTISSDASGKITGTQTGVLSGTYNGSPYTLDVASTVRGKLGVRAGLTGASLKASGTLSGSDTGKAKGSSTALIIESNLTVSVDLKETISPRHVKSVTFSKKDLIADLPAEMDGDWSLTIISTNVNKVGGTGIITLSNGRALTNALSGSYNSAKGTAKLKLKGEGAAKGVSVSLTTTNAGAGEAAMTLTGLKGKVLGQKPMFP